MFLTLSDLISDQVFHNGFLYYTEIKVIDDIPTNIVSQRKSKNNVQGITQRTNKHIQTCISVYDRPGMIPLEDTEQE
jgi:hypothetical protein